MAECKASTEYIQGYYPYYVFDKEKDVSHYPKGCYVLTFTSSTTSSSTSRPMGYFNTHESDDSNSRSRALCTRPEE